MTENKPCDPWLLEQEKEEKYINSAIKCSIQKINIPCDNPPFIVGNLPPYFRYEKFWPEPENGGHDFGLPINKKENND